MLKGHPPTFIDIFKNEAKSKDDGLIQRFQLCAPNPLLPDADEIKNGPKKYCSLSVLFYIIIRINEKKIQYLLSKQAENEFNTIYSKFRNLIKIFIKKDGFIR